MDHHCHIRLTNSRINVQEALDFVNSPFCGGTSIFVGSTRITESNQETKPVQYLVYEAYEEMALQVMRQIVTKTLDSSSERDLHKVYLLHRLGQVNLGEESILIAVSSPHRSSCHEMVMNILNEVKRKVPIWKKVCFVSEGSQQDKKDQTTMKWSANSEAFWLSSHKN